MKKFFFFLLVCITASFSGMSYAQQPERMQLHNVPQMEPLNPLEFGLAEAKDSKSRFAALYNCHLAAKESGVGITYKGIDTIWLEIPDDARTLPLPYHTDFAGVVLMVRNDSERDFTLFALDGDEAAKPLQLDKSLLESCDFRDVKELRDGDFLLIVNDTNPWVAERIGYGSPAMRADLLYINNGVSANRPITSYSNPAAKPVFSYVPVNSDPKTVENIIIHRGRGEKHKTYCFRISNQNNVTISNVLITTPKGKHIADGAISIRNSANTTVEDVTVDSTYSVPGGYGYAISMGNVWNTKFIRFTADAAWGVFGSNNVSSTTLLECDVNRFDIHCYGRDVTMSHCTFRNKQTQFSSMYGKVVFDSCHFIDCIPVRIRSSYNAYTPFDIELRHCTFDATVKHHALVNVMLLSTTPNERPELEARCWPNVLVEDLTVNLPVWVRSIDVIDPTGTLSECKKPVEYMRYIRINGLRVIRKDRKVKCNLHFTSHAFSTVQQFRIDYKDVELNGGKMVSKIKNFEF